MKRIQQVNFLFWAIGAMFMASIANAQGIAPHQQNTEQASLLHYEIVTLPANGQLPRSKAWNLELQGQTFHLQARDNQRLLDHYRSNAKSTISPDTARFYEGTLLDESGHEIADSWLRLSWVKGEWSGGWFTQGQLYLVDSLDNVVDWLSTEQHEEAQRLLSQHELIDVVYRMDDLTLPMLYDANPIYPLSPKQQSKRTTQRFLEHIADTSRGVSVLRELELTIVSDTQFSNINGTQTSANVIARINFADGIYTNQLGVTLTILHHEILSNNGTLTSNDIFVLLQEQFAPYMRNGPGSSLPRGDIAHLFTGRSFSSGFVGLAFIGVLCSTNFGYGVDQNFNGNTTSALIFAHELGHNFSAPHDGEEACINETFRGIMNPSINGSTQFSNCSIQQMSDDIAAASCMAEIIINEEILLDGFELN